MNDFIEEVQDIIFAELEKTYELQRSKAQDLSITISKKITSLYRGNQFYIPSKTKRQRQERNCQIRKKLNGTNIRELCKEYGLSHTSIYKITKSKS
jgi:Mor family transcriptional regulator